MAYDHKRQAWIAQVHCSKSDASKESDREIGEWVRKYDMKEDECCNIRNEDESRSREELAEGRNEIAAIGDFLEEGYNEEKIEKVCMLPPLWMASRTANVSSQIDDKHRDSASKDSIGKEILAHRSFCHAKHGGCPLFREEDHKEQAHEADEYANPPFDRYETKDDQDDGKDEDCQDLHSELALARLDRLYGTGQFWMHFPMITESVCRPYNRSFGKGNH